jgi:hypothetical protein
MIIKYICSKCDIDLEFNLEEKTKDLHKFTNCPDTNCKGWIYRKDDLKTKYIDIEEAR